MKICSNCGAQLEDNAVFCSNCGVQFVASQQPNQEYRQNPYNQNFATAYDPYDHTAEFDPKDISENKVFAMLVYLLGTIGVIIALLASKTSAYTMFHVRQALKFTVVNILMTICTVLLCWTFIVPIAYGIMVLVLGVIKIVCFFQICSGKAKEPAVIRSLNFLK